MNKNILIGIVVIVIILLGFNLTGDKTPTETGPISIGFIGPLSGDAAIYGEPMKDSVALAVAEINADGGINGRELQVIYEDGLCDGKGATNAIQKLINVDGVKVIIGGVCSGETLGAAPVAERSQVILFSAGSGSPDITNAGDYIFRNFPSDASSGRKMAEEAISRDLKKVALLVETTDYAQAIKGVFTERFLELGGEIVIDESFASNVTDLRTPLTKIKSANPDAIYLLAQTPANAEIGIKQISELNLGVQLLSNEMLGGEALLTSVGSLIEGAIYAEPAFDENEADSKAYLDKYRETYGGLGEGLPPVYLATANDAVYIIAELLEKHGEDVEKIKRDLYKIKDRKGTAGMLTMDKNGDPIFEYVVKMIQDGKPVIVE